MIIDFISRNAKILSHISCVFLGFAFGCSSWILFFISLFLSLFFNLTYSYFSSYYKIKCLGNIK